MRYKGQSCEPSPALAVDEFVNALQVLVMSIEAWQRQATGQCEHCDAVQRVSERVLASARNLKTCLHDLANER